MTKLQDNQRIGKIKNDAAYEYWKEVRGGLDDTEADDIETFDLVQDSFVAGFEAALKMLDKRRK